MPFWNDLYFMDANSPIMEQMIFFHDHSMMIIMVIMLFLTMIMYLLMMSKYLNLNLTENQITEMIWTLMPMVLLFPIAMPSMKVLYLMEETFSPQLTIKTIGHQWYWSYEYTEFNLNFDSFMLSEYKKDNFRLMETDISLVLPINSYSRMLVSSQDVIHSWTIQSLGVKTDAIPGRLNQINLNPSRPGLYYGQCSEICGMNHSFMPISLKISSLKQFLMMIKKIQ